MDDDHGLRFGPVFPLSKSPSSLVEHLRRTGEQLVACGVNNAVVLERFNAIRPFRIFRTITCRYEVEERAPDPRSESRQLIAQRFSGWAKVHLSTRQLERLFKEQIRQSPQAAYLSLRLKHARWMLKTNLSLVAIAVETGFVDGSHLSKAFKAAFGYNPSEERRRLGTLTSGDVASEPPRIFDPV